MNKNAIKEQMKKLGALAKHLFLHNVMLKVLSLLLAMGLWAFVLTNDTTITRERTLTNLYVTTANQSVLDSRELAITESLSDILPQVRVSVEVSQSDYYRLTSNNVRVELDLSHIRETGKQTVPLTASSVYGTVTGLYPDSVTLDVDELAVRNLQVEVGLKDADESKYWYSATTSNPAIITVTGPASQVEQVTSAYAEIDLVGVKTVGQIARAVSFKLLDDKQQPVEYDTLETSTSSVIVGVEIYPTATVPVETDLANVITGSLPMGYQIDSVEVQPSTVTVAGTQRFLDSIDAVQIYAINVSNMKETATKTARVNRQSSMKYVSSEDVLLTVHISEKQLSRGFDTITPEVIGLGEGLTAQVNTVCSASVTGPYTQVAALTRNNLQVYVDASGLAPGVYSLPLQCRVASDSEFETVCGPDHIKVTIK